MIRLFPKDEYIGNEHIAHEPSIFQRMKITRKQSIFLLSLLGLSFCTLTVLLCLLIIR